MDLIDAIIERKLDMIQDLLEEGVDPNWAEDVAKVTPLHFAVIYKFPEAIPLLLEAGADPHQADTDGITPLELAVEIGDEGVVRRFGDLEG